MSAYRHATSVFSRDGVTEGQMSLFQGFAGRNAFLLLQAEAEVSVTSCCCWPTIVVVL